MVLQTEDKKIAFCQALFREACKEAQQRIGPLTKSEQIQMSDLIKAFRGLKLTAYSAQFGHIDTEWNDALAIVGEYSSVSQRKEPPHLPQEIGEAIGHAIISWNNFDKLPADTKEFIKKTHENFLNTKEKMLQHMGHFFYEIHVRASSLSTSEKETVLALLAMYEPQFKEIWKKGNMTEVHASLENLLRELNKLTQKENPSRDLQSFVTKARHDLDHFKTMNF